MRDQVEQVVFRRFVIGRFRLSGNNAQAQGHADILHEVAVVITIHRLDDHKGRGRNRLVDRWRHGTNKNPGRPHGLAKRLAVLVHFRFYRAAFGVASVHGQGKGRQTRSQMVADSLQKQKRAHRPSPRR